MIMTMTMMIIMMMMMMMMSMIVMIIGHFPMSHGFVKLLHQKKDIESDNFQGTYGRVPKNRNPGRYLVKTIDCV